MYLSEFSATCTLGNIKFLNQFDKEMIRLLEQVKTRSKTWFLDCNF